MYENQKTYCLACDGGKRRSACPQIERVNKKRIQKHIQYSAACQSDRAKGGVAFGAQDVVHHKARANYRSADQNPFGVIFRVRKNRRRGAQKADQALEVAKAHDGKRDAKKNRGGKSGRAANVGGLLIFFAKPARDDGAAAHSNRKANRLDYRHQRKNYANRGARAGSQLRHKVSVGGIVDAGCHHAQNGR